MPIFRPYKPTFVDHDVYPIAFESETQLVLTETFQKWVRNPKFQGFTISSNEHPSKQGELMYTVGADLGNTIHPVGFTETALNLEYVVHIPSSPDKWEWGVTWWT